MLGNKNKKEEGFKKNSVAAIKKWVGEKINIPQGAVLMVTEINCWEPGCPDKETIIAVLQEKNIQKFSIKKPLVYVRQWDVETAMREYLKEDS